MTLRRLGSALVALGLLATLGAAPARAASFAILDSDPGDPVGGGGHYQLGSPEGAFLVVPDIGSFFSGRAFVLRFTSPTDSWEFAFSAGVDGAPLAPGVYDTGGLSRGPQLSVHHGQESCALPPTGRFQIHSMTFAADGRPLALDVDFVQSCQSVGPQLRGVIRFGAGDAACAGAPDGTPCNDLNACTAGDVCRGGSCASGGPVGCDDHDAGTDDVCFVDGGCSNPIASSTWSIEGDAVVTASAEGRTIRSRQPLQGFVLLRVDHTYEIPSGVCPRSGAPLPSEVGTWRADRRGRIHLAHSNVRRVLRAIGRCAGLPPLVVSGYRHWVDIGTAGGSFCSWHPVPADGRHLCGLARLHGTVVVSGVTVTEDEVIKYAAARTDAGGFVPHSAAGSVPGALPAILPVEGVPLAAALSFASP